MNDEVTGRLTLDTFCTRADLHPDFVRKLVDLGVVDVEESEGRTWIDGGQYARVARAQRLHDGLSLNWAAVGVVVDLLDRIDALEDEVERLRAVARRD